MCIYIFHSGIGALQDVHNQPTVSLWSLDVPLKIKVTLATYVNVRDRGEVRFPHLMMIMYVLCLPFLRGGDSMLSSSEAVITFGPVHSLEINKRLYKSLRLIQTSKECVVELVDVS